MRICVFGAGAIGSLIGARLAASGVDVSLIARGAHLDAIRERGLVLLEGESRVTVRPRATDDPAELGPQDHVIVTLKASSVPEAVEVMAPLLGMRGPRSSPRRTAFRGGSFMPSRAPSRAAASRASTLLAASGPRSDPSARSAASSIRRAR